MYRECGVRFRLAFADLGKAHARRVITSARTGNAVALTTCRAVHNESLP